MVWWAALVALHAVSSNHPNERRRYRRIDAPIYYRGARLFGSKRQTASDVSLGGIRIVTDDALRVGKRIEIELFLSEGASVTCDVRVAWMREAPAGAAARYEAGLSFVGLKEEDADLLRAHLDRESSE